jgi:hypothetical protein
LAPLPSYRKQHPDHNGEDYEPQRVKSQTAWKNQQSCKDMKHFDDVGGSIVFFGGNLEGGADCRQAGQQEDPAPEMA